MLLNLLKLIRPDAKKVAWVQAGALVFVIVAFLRQHEAYKLQSNRLSVAQEALKHPQVVERVVKINVAGPTRIVTRIVERPSGEKETTTDASTFGVVEFAGDQKESRPVGLDELLGSAATPARTDRWLVGVSNRSLTFDEVDHYGVWGGYSFRNRVDALVGVTKHDHEEINLLAVVRF